MLTIGIMIALGVTRVESDNRPVILSYDREGTLIWTSETTNIYAGIEYTSDLSGWWTREAGSFWNIYVHGRTNVWELGVPEGLDRLFLRVVCSTNSLLGAPYNVNELGIPAFVTSDYIEIDKVGRISRFRSGIGHDYSDDFESCRSMKHYFEPNVAQWSGIRIFSPVEGTVYTLNREWAGTQVWLQSSEFPAFFFIIFHVDPLSSLKLGNSVRAGEQIGTHIGNQTKSDIAVGINTPGGWKLVSYFEVMDNALFAAYQAKGVFERSDLIISAEQRNLDPLSCEGEEFTGPGSIPNWVELSGGISGTVTVSGGQPLQDIAVISFRWSGFGWEHAQDAGTNLEGKYEFPPLSPGMYRVKFMDFSHTYAEQYYDGAPEFDSATDIHVESGVNVSNINAILLPQ